MIYIGIDPGVGGGIAALTDGGMVLRAVKALATIKDLQVFLDTLIRDSAEGRPVAVLERVWSIPGQGHSGAFSFGRGYGHYEATLTALEIPYDEIIPRNWQKRLGVIYPKGAGDTEKKNIAKRRAQQLFPRETITHAIADALLIAEHCRRMNRGMYGEEKSEKPRADRKSQARIHIPEGFYQRREDARSAEAIAERRLARAGKRSAPQARGRGTDAARHGKHANPSTR